MADCQFTHAYNYGVIRTKESKENLSLHLSCVLHKLLAS